MHVSPDHKGQFKSKLHTHVVTPITGGWCSIAQRERERGREAGCELDLQLCPVLPIATSVTMTTQNLDNTRTHRKIPTHILFVQEVLAHTL